MEDETLLSPVEERLLELAIWCGGRMEDETTEVLLDLLFDVDAIWGVPMTRDDALLVFAVRQSLRDSWLRRALGSGHPQARAVIAAWARAHGWVELADELLAGTEDQPRALWPERFVRDASPHQRIITGHESFESHPRTSTPSPNPERFE